MIAQRNPHEPIALTDHHSIYAECVRLRHQLAGSERARSLLSHDLDAAYVELRRERLERRRLEGLMRAVPARSAQAEEWAYGAVASGVLLWERVAARWWALWDGRRPLGTTGRLALLVIVLDCLGWALVFGGGR